MNKNKILVPLSDNSYEVTIKQGVINSIGEELIRLGINNDRKILIVSNKEISKLFGGKLLNNLKKYNFNAEILNISALKLFFFKLLRSFPPNSVEISLLETISIFLLLLIPIRVSSSPMLLINPCFIITSYELLLRGTSILFLFTINILEEFFINFKNWFYLF